MLNLKHTAATAALLLSAAALGGCYYAPAPDYAYSAPAYGYGYAPAYYAAPYYGYAPYGGVSVGFGGWGHRRW